MDKILINMDEIFNNKVKEEYISTRDELFAIVETNIDARRNPVTCIIDKEEYNMTVGNALTLMVCYRVFMETKCKFSKDFLFDPSDINNINNFFDDVLDYTLYNLEEEDFQMVKEVITVIISDLANISGVVNTNYGNTINIKSFIDLARRNEEFKELLYLKLPDEDLQFNEIEEFIKKSLDRTIEILKKEDNVLRMYLSSGSGINLKQLGQVLNIVGSKPDLDGTVIPYPINTSFIRGLDLPSYFINAKGCRKALITNSTQVRSSGYLNRKASLACLDTHSISPIKKCDTKHPVPINIFNKGVLKRFNGRYYLGEDGKDHLITINDTDLIGKVIKVYSPLTCSCKDGICERCYGKLARFNRDINIGIVAVLLLTEPLTQRLLSSKHLLTTRSKKIEWGEDFENYFIVNLDNISYINSKIKIKINKSDIEEDEFSEVFSFNTMTIVEKNKETPITVPVTLNINKQLVDIFKYYDEEEDAYVISGLSEKNIFYYIMDNIELSSSLNAIKDILDKNEFLENHTMFETINEMLYLIEESAITINSVHLELILRCLTIMDDRGDFNKEEFPQYKMYRIKEAILKGGSLSKGLTFEELNKQLSTLTYDIFNKNEESLLDGLL